MSGNYSSQNKSASAPPSYPRKQVSGRGGFQTRPYICIPGRATPDSDPGLPGMTPKLLNELRIHDTSFYHCFYMFPIAGSKASRNQANDLFTHNVLTNLYPLYADHKPRYFRSACCASVQRFIFSGGTIPGSLHGL